MDLKLLRNKSFRDNYNIRLLTKNIQRDVRAPDSTQDLRSSPKPRPLDSNRDFIVGYQTFILIKLSVTIVFLPKARIRKFDALRPRCTTLQSWCNSLTGILVRPPNATSSKILAISYSIGRERGRSVPIQLTRSGCRCALASRPSACASPLLVKVLQGTRLFLEHLHHKLPWQLTGVLSDCVSSTLKISACPLQSFHQPPTCHQILKELRPPVLDFLTSLNVGSTIRFCFLLHVTNCCSSCIQLNSFQWSLEASISSYTSSCVGNSQNSAWHHSFNARWRVGELTWPSRLFFDFISF